MQNNKQLELKPTVVIVTILFHFRSNLFDFHKTSQVCTHWSLDYLLMTNHFALFFPNLFLIFISVLISCQKCGTKTNGWEGVIIFVFFIEWYFSMDWLGSPFMIIRVANLTCCCRLFKFDVEAHFCTFSSYEEPKTRWLRDYESTEDYTVL